MNPLDQIMKYGLSLGMVLATAFGAYQWRMADNAERTVMVERNARQNEDLQRGEKARIQIEANRELEQHRALKGQEILNGLQAEIDLRQTQLGLERTASGRLRGTIATYAADRGPAGQTCSAELEGARNRATTLGDLLTQADGLAGEFADAAERHAAEARSLKERVLADRE